MAIDEQLDHKDHLQPLRPSTDAIDGYYLSLSTGGPTLEERPGDKLRSCRSTDQGRPQVAASEEPRMTRTRFSWHKGFLTTHKPPTRRITPMSTQQSRSTSGNNPTNNLHRGGSAASRKGIQSTKKIAF